MTKNLIIIALVIALIYFYYQNRKLKGLPATTQTIYELDEDLVAEKDEAVRKKNEAEQEASDLGNKLKLKQQEVSRKDKEIDRLKKEKSQSETALNEKIKELKKDLTSEKQQHKGSLERITKLTEQINDLRKAVKKKD